MDDCNVDTVHVQTVLSTVGYTEGDDVAVDKDDLIDQSEDELDRLIQESIEPNSNQLEYVLFVYLFVYLSYREC